MHSFKTLGILLMGCTFCLSAMAQEEDSVISRNVTVEREYKPIIKSAGKLNIRPKQVDTRVEPVDVVYSEYSSPLNTTYNIKPLASSDVRFRDPSAPNGHLGGALGYPLSKLDFGYMLRPTQDVEIGLYANHDSEWGIRSLSQSQIGMDFVKKMQTMQVYFDVNGNHTYYTRYGRYYRGDNQYAIPCMTDLNSLDKQHVWEINSKVGLRSKIGESMQFRVQTGYNNYIMPDSVVEHMIRTHLDVAWHGNSHLVGANLMVQNSFFTVDDKMQLDENDYGSRHAIRIEPFYGYESEHLLLHAGVNLDMNVGKGTYLSNVENLSFAPSPNVQMEYRILPTWLAVYARADGQFGMGTLQGGMVRNPYIRVDRGVLSKHVASYVPVEASLGIKLKPASTLFMNIYGRFACMKNHIVYVGPTLDMLQHDATTFIDYFYADYNRWTVGAELTYHYQDILHLLLTGNYYVWDLRGMDTPESFPEYNHAARYDRPDWDLHFRLDANINSKWSVYTDDIFAGNFQALLRDGTSVRMKEKIDLRLGARYNINRWLYCYAQLNNLLNRHHDIFYGYQSQGINGEIGVHWQF